MNKEKTHWMFTIILAVSLGVVSNIVFNALQTLLPNLAILIIAVASILILLTFVVWLDFKYFSNIIANEIHKKNTFNFSFLGVLGKVFHKDNIAMRTQTIQIILDHFLTDGNEGIDLNRMKLTELGRRVGKSCNADVSGNLRMPSEFQKSPQDAIKNWLNIETHANWAIFEVDFTDIGDGKFSGRIKLKNCFLISGRSYKDKDLVPFLIGYFEEIISQLAKFNVEIFEVQAGRHIEHGSCEFAFKPAN